MESPRRVRARYVVRRARVLMPIRAMAIWPLRSEMDGELEPAGAARLIDAHGVDVAGRAFRGGIEVLGVGDAEQVVDTGAEGERLAKPYAAVDREDAEAGTGPQILADDVALAHRHAMLRAGQPPQAADRPRIACVGEAEARFQRRHLRQRSVLAAVFAPGGA